MSKRLVAIHQPNFFPWLGYFDKLVRADVFIVLDHVQFPKSEGNWSNRVKFAMNGRAGWATMPVVRAYSGFRRVDEMQINDGVPWRRKLLQMLRTEYGKAAAFDAVFPAVKAWVEHPSDRLADYNLHAITSICEQLELPSSHLVRSSSLAVAGTKTDLLVSIVKAVEGTTYLSGDGSDGYQDDTLFTAAGIDLAYQRFVHPVYPQRGLREFLPGLSIVDALFNCGFGGCAKLLDVTRRVERPTS